MTQSFHNFQGLRVLMVDDEPFSIQSLSDLLKASGTTVTYISTLEEAVGRLKCDDRPLPLDLVVLDLRFNNGIPSELNGFVKGKKDYISYGAALTAWIDANIKEPPLPYVFYTVFPKKIPSGSTALDKMDPILEVAKQLEAFVRRVRPEVANDFRD